MWLKGYRSEAHHVYFGTDEKKIELANENSDSYKGRFTNNIFSPGDLSPGQTYYWRVDVVRADNTTKGRTWSFTVENEIAQK